MFFSGDSGVGNVSFALESKDPGEEYIFMSWNQYIRKSFRMCEKLTYLYILNLYMKLWGKGERAETTRPEKACQFTTVNKLTPLVRIFGH